MSNLQIIEALCSLVESQAQLIQRFAFALSEAGYLNEEDARLMTDTQKKYSEILEADEAPDNL